MERISLKSGVITFKKGKEWCFRYYDNLITLDIDDNLVFTFLESLIDQPTLKVFMHRIKDHRILHSLFKVLEEHDYIYNTYERIEYTYHNHSVWPPYESSFTPYETTQFIIKSQHETNNLQGIFLDDENMLGKTNDVLQTIIQSRMSPQGIEPIKKISKNTLSLLLRYTVGTKDNNKRVYPSAGGLYPNSVFIDIKKVNDIESGLYKYNPKNHKLILIKKDSMISTSLIQPNIEYNFCCIIATDLEKSAAKYGTRGYRFCLIEAGHMAQNLLLYSYFNQIKGIPVGGFKDNIINDEINQGEIKNYLSLYIIPFGKGVK